MKEFSTINYETPADHIVRITLDRPKSRNAQDTHLLYELNDAFDIAAQDDEVKVIILAANGFQCPSNGGYLVRARLRRRRAGDDP
jgi:enoyl-CoA hydratase